MTIKDIFETTAHGAKVYVRVFAAPKRYTDYEVTFDNVDQLSRDYAPECIVPRDNEIIIETA